MSAPDPFRDPEQSEPRVKALIYGPSGIGKTWLALTAPGPVAVIDTEGGTAFYANRVGPKGLSPFRVLPTKTFVQVEQAVAFLKANPGAYQTLVIDPVTVLWEVLQDAAQRRRAEVRHNADADLEMLDWQRIKAVYKRLMNDIANLDMHVIVTAREADLSEERVGPNGRKERVKIGVRPEAEKGTTYYFDTVLRMVPAGKGRAVVVEKDRTDALAFGATIPAPTFESLFGDAVKRDGTAKRAVPSDDEAARIDAATTITSEELRDREETLTPLGHVTREGVIERGEGVRSDLMPRPQPDGTDAVGFLLNTGGNQRPQVWALGAIGSWLVDAAEGDTGDLLKARVTVSGELFEVQVPGRKKTYRLIVDAISGPFGTFPPAQPEGPTEAESEPLFSPEAQAELDAQLAAL